MLPPKTTPKHAADKALAAKIKEWREVSDWLDTAKENEMRLLKEIAAAVFPKPEKGVNDALVSGCGPAPLYLKMTHKLNVKVDEAELAVRAKQLVAMGIPLDKLISYSPKVVQKELDALPSKLAKHFALVLEIKPGAPSLEIGI